MRSSKHCCHNAEPALITATGKAFVAVLSQRNDFPIGNGSLPAGCAASALLVLWVTIPVGMLHHCQALTFLFLQEAPGQETKLQNHRLILIYIKCESHFGLEAYEFLILIVQYIRMTWSFADQSCLIVLDMIIPFKLPRWVVESKCTVICLF